MKAVPSSGVEIYLDPETARAQKARRDLRHNVVIIPQLRLAGFILVGSILLVHEWLLEGGVDWTEHIVYIIAAVGYSLLSWWMLARYYRPYARVDLAFAFFITDIAFWAYAVYVSGGERSWLFFILNAHVLDQTATSVRRVLLFAHLGVIAYLATLGWIALVDGQAVNWGEGIAKATLLYGFGLYGSLTAIPTEALRRRSTSAIRMARASIAELEDKSAQLEEAKRRAEEASAAKTLMLSRVSHEMRTPMNAILGFAQLLDSEELTPPLRSNVAHILESGEHLLQLIDDVLELEHIEQGRVVAEIGTVGVRDVVDETVRMTQPIATTHGVTIECTIAADVVVQADRRRLKQVLLNLISNAVKYNCADGRVTIHSAAGREGRLRIQVTDTGRGMAPEQLAQLFTPFERLGAEASQIKGTGLGLAVSRALVSAMGGELQVESERGKGSTFAVELPSVTGLAAPRAETSTVAATEPASRATLYRQPHVLCVEDNPSNAKLVEILLARRCGMRVTFADTGTRALELARASHLDLVLLDLNLPEISGLDVLRVLRADPRTRYVKVIIVSADAIPQHINELLAAGADDYITKPYDISRFLDVVNRALAGSPAASADE